MPYPTSYEKAYIVQTAMVSPTFLRMAYDKIDVSRDFTDSEEALRYIWMVLKACWDKYEVLADRHVLVTELNTAKEEENKINGFSTLEREDVSEGLFQIIENVYDSGFSANEKYAKDILQNLLDARVQQELTDTLAVSPEGDITNFMEAMSTSFLSTRLPTDNAEYDPTDLTDPRVYSTEKAPPLPTGFKVFDGLLDGSREGHLLGLLASSGGGKTTFCIQTAAEIANRGGSVYYFSFEQKIEKELMWRFWSSLLGVSEEHFLGLDVRESDHPVAQQLRDCMSNMQGRCRFFDCMGTSMGNNGISDIENKIEQDIEAGNPKPALIIIDWLGNMADKVIAHKNMDLDQKRAVMASTCSAAKGLADKFSCQIIIPNQLNAKAGEAPPGHRPSQYDSSDFRMFSNLMDGCIVFSKPDNNNVCQVYLDKMRGDKKGLFIYIIGEHSRMQVINGSWQLFKQGDGSYEWSDDSSDAVRPAG